MADFPSEPWQILNLDPATATEAAVKRAYAQLIKKHRPEADPEGFQRVHGAYQMALAELRAKLEPALISEPPLAPDDARPVVTPALPAVCMAWEEKLAAAVGQRDSAGVAACLEEFRPLMKEDTSLWRPWGVILARQFEKEVPLLAANLPAPGAVRLLEAGQPDLLQAVLVAWHETGRSEDLLRVARTVLPRLDLVNDGPPAVCVARLAMLVSFRSPKLGEALANLAFKHLPPGQTRDWIMRQVENRLSLGHIFTRLPKESLRFWEERLTLDEDPTLYAWDGPEGQKQLSIVSRNMPVNWAGHGVLQQILPPKLWAHMQSMSKRGPSMDQRPGIQARLTPQYEAAPKEERRRHRSPSPYQGGASNLPFRLGCLFIFLLLKIVFLLFTSK